mmetsp:Transcript_30410/g.29765  ORF Transcript_30410/g.29765 Transcript_30410/m.29765 type:complete len:234 (+) Transcript_30410:142-843(+)
MHRDEVQAVILLDEPSHLSISHPGSPLLSHWPVERLDPSSGSIGAHDSVRVSRIDQYPVVTLQHLIHPLRGFRLVVIVSLRLAAFIAWSFHRDVHGESHVSPIEIVGGVVSQKDLVEGFNLGEPGRVLLECISSLVGFFDSINHHGRHSVFILEEAQRVWIEHPIQVIDVEILGGNEDIIKDEVAGEGVVGGVGIVEGEEAVFLNPSVVDTLSDHVEVVGGGHERGPHVNGVV